MFCYVGSRVTIEQLDQMGFYNLITTYSTVDADYIEKLRQGDQAVFTFNFQPPLTI